MCCVYVCICVCAFVCVCVCVYVCVCAFVRLATLHVPWKGPAVVVTLHVPWKAPCNLTRSVGKGEPTELEIVGSLCAMATQFLQSQGRQ